MCVVGGGEMDLEYYYSIAYLGQSRLSGAVPAGDLTLSVLLCHTIC